MTKKALLGFLLAGNIMSASAQGSLPAQLGSCLSIQGVLQRLACYDRVAHGVAPVPAARGIESPVSRTQPPPAYAVPPPVAAPATGLGSERLPHTASARRSTELVARVESISFDPRGRFTVTLDNGQVWRQLQGDTTMLLSARVSVVRISRGALGSYDLKADVRNATYRVTRLQ